MTVSTTTARNVKACNGVTTSFPFDFAFEVEGDLIVNRVVIISGVETLQVLTTDYTVTGGSGASGTIEMVSAPPGLDELVIERDLAYTQGTDYQPNDPFPAEVNETALDRLTFLVQQVLELTKRAIKLPLNTALSGIEFPIPVALKTFRWDATATALEQTDDPAVSAAAAAVSEANAATSETNAATSETNAASSATAASSSETAAATSETNAATSETNAATSETNAAASATTAESAAQAVAERYDFDSSVVMADPGTGDIRYNNATVASVTQIAIAANTAGAGAPDISARIVTWDDSTNSTLRGTLVIRKGGTPATFAVFDITGVIVDNTTWLQIPVAHVASAGAWSAADDMYVEFTRTGNQGGIANPMSAVLNTGGFSIDFSQGANVTAAATMNIWAGDGNHLKIDGNTGITGLTAAPRAGATAWLIFNGTPLLTNGANFRLPGARNYQVVANDLVFVYAETTTIFRLEIFPKDGRSDLRNIEVITSTGTYTKPVGLKRARVRLWGGGGGSGGCAATGATTVAAAGGGGGGGGMEELFEASEIGVTETVTIGAGGLAGTAGANPGGAGGTTSFGSLGSATGGLGGAGSSPGSTDKNGAAGGGEGAGSGGDVDHGGSPGFNGIQFGVAGVAISGHGGDSKGGGGRDVAISGSGPGDPGANYGGGAAGSALGFSQSAQVGSAGAPGLILVEEYF